MNRELLVRVYKIINAVDQVYADIEAVVREMRSTPPPVASSPDDVDAQAETMMLTEYLSMLYERGGDALERVRAYQGSRSSSHTLWD